MTITTPKSTAVDGASSGSSRITLRVLLLLALSAAWCAVWFFHALHYWEDDAYIHLEFARSVARGQGFAFNGRVVYGDTSPLWVYLLVGFHAVIRSWAVAGKLLTVCGVLFASAGAFFYARKLTGNLLFAAAMVLVFVANPYFTYWSFSGMETITAAGLAFWGATLVSDSVLCWPRFLAGCLIAGLGPLLRPEMAFLSAVLALLLVYRWFHIPGDLLKRLLGLFAGFALAVSPTVAWGVYALHTFGRLVPNTNAAKRAAPHDSVLLRLVNVYALGFPVLLLAAAVGVLYLAYALVRSRRGETSTPLGVFSRRLPAAGWVFAVWSAICILFYCVDHTYVQTRYIFVSASGLLIAALAVLFLWQPRAGSPDRPLAVPSIALALVLASAVSVCDTWLFIRNKVEGDQASTALALYIRDHLPPSAPVADYSIGQVAYLSEHPIIDTGGITDPSVIPYLDSPAAVEQWSRSAGAQYAVSGYPPEPGSVLVFSVDRPPIGWFLDPRKYRGKTALNLWRLPTVASWVPASGGSTSQSSQNRYRNIH